MKPSLLFAAVLLSVGFAKVSMAGPLVSNGACKLTDVQVTSVTPLVPGGTSTVVPSPTGNANACIGAVTGNDDVSKLEGNLGLENVGFLNDKELFPNYGAFLEQEDLQDIGTPGSFVDPGWIFVQKIDFNDNGTITEEFGSMSKSLGEGNDKETLTFTFSSVLSIKFNEGSSSSGTFIYSPPTNNPQELVDILGFERFFDQLAIVFKSANGFAIYNFTLEQFSLAPVIGTEAVNYEFAGTWDMSNTLRTRNNRNAAGLSHVTLWLRDPRGPTTYNVPEPSTALLAFAGLGLMLSSRIRSSRKA